MVKIYLSSLINLPLIIEGSTSSGKISSAIAFSKIRGTIYKEEPYYKLYSFNILISKIMIFLFLEIGDLAQSPRFNFIIIFSELIN